MRRCGRARALLGGIMGGRRLVAALGALGIAVTAVTLGAIAASSGVAGARTAPPAATPPPTTAAFDLNVSVQAGGTTYGGSVVGNVNLASGKFAATIDVPGGFGTVISAISPRLASLVPSAVDADTTAQAVFTGRTIYLSMAGLPTQWVAFPVTLPGGAKKALTAAAKGLENVKKLGRLAKRLDLSVTSLGTEQIDGVTAKGYSTSVGVASLLSLLPGLGSATGTQVIGMLGPSVPVTVWAEPAGPVVLLSVDLAPPAGSPIQSLQLSLGLSNWGEAVTVTAPPAADVMRIPLTL